MAARAHVTPVVDSTAVFKDGLFKGKVLFCTGGGSGICKEMTRAVVRRPGLAIREYPDTHADIDAPWCRCCDCRKEVSRNAFAGVLSPILTAGSDRLDRLTQSAEELSKATGRTCLPVQGDVRQPKAIQDAVANTIEKFGKIDFVICGTFVHWSVRTSRIHLWRRSCRKLLGSYFWPVRERFPYRD